ncbi:MAG: MBL fold metallo-hydrolase [Oscillospiraceae bacterium]|jgi:glyoxylase-like metal-dependent hydrolase (beta-lactamase superfamily II)|nr:MBL fold metallo-hydrolase [Oscillospiraceae bacterium]
MSEVILTRHGEGKLATKTYYADESGFCVASVIVMGKKECVLIDCQFTRSNALRVIAEILETGLDLKAVFATHLHPDHYWGMGEIERAFPNAKCYMLPEEVPLYADQYHPKLDEWIEMIGEQNLCRKQCENLLPLESRCIELEGERIEIMEHIMGDLKWNSVVWIPSIKTMYGSDVIFNEAHPFTCEVSAVQRLEWIGELERLERELQPDVVIPGHQRAGCLLDRSGIKYTIDYLKATEEAMKETNDAASFFFFLEKRFPNNSISMLSNQMNALVFKDPNFVWGWESEERKAERTS